MLFHIPYLTGPEHVASDIRRPKQSMQARHRGRAPRTFCLNKMPLDLAESRKIKDQGQGNH